MVCLVLNCVGSIRFRRVSIYLLAVPRMNLNVLFDKYVWRQPLYVKKFRLKLVLKFPRYALIRLNKVRGIIVLKVII